MKYQLYPEPKKRRIFLWVFVPLFMLALTTWFYVLDYMNVIDFPVMDSQYDRNATTK